jgi:hypothetical protein
VARDGEPNRVPLLIPPPKGSSPTRAEPGHSGQIQHWADHGPGRRRGLQRRSHMGANKPVFIFVLFDSVNSMYWNCNTVLVFGLYNYGIGKQC